MHIRERLDSAICITTMLGRTTSLFTCGCCIADGWTHITMVAGRTGDVLRERTDGRTFTDEAAAAFTRLGFKFETNAENGSLARVTRSRASSNYLLQINRSGKSLIASNACRRGITIWQERCPAPLRTPLAASSRC